MACEHEGMRTTIRGLLLTLCLVLQSGCRKHDSESIGARVPTDAREESVVQATIDLAGANLGVLDLTLPFEALDFDRTQLPEMGDELFKHFREINAETNHLPLSKSRSVPGYKILTLALSGDPDWWERAESFLGTRDGFVAVALPALSDREAVAAYLVFKDARDVTGEAILLQERFGIWSVTDRTTLNVRTRAGKKNVQPDH